MRRIVLIATAIVSLVAAGAAYAAINSYSATIKLTSKKAGTAAKPVTLGYTEDLQAAGTNGNRTAPLTDIKTTIYGLKEDGKDFPTCTLAQISNAHTDAGCPRKAEVATGDITAIIGPAANLQSGGIGCNPLLDVWNGGQGKLTFFFVDQGSHQCAGGALRTGSVGPYPGTYRTVGRNLVVDVPIPTAVSFPIPGEVGSLQTEHLVWIKRTAKLKNGKRASSLASFACSRKTRPYSVAFTAAQPNPDGTPGARETDTVKGTAACS